MAGGYTVIAPACKTGGKRPERHGQIVAYRDALTALGHTKVQGLLVYMEDGEVIGA